MLRLTVNTTELTFEHSLVSLSRWEAEYEKPFYGPEDKTNDEMMRYFEYMLVSPQKKRHLIMLLSPDQILVLANYLGKSSTATTVREIQQGNKSSNRERVTSELIYYWLVAFKIPFAPVETWHLNRLLMLIKVSGAKQAPPKKMSRGAKQQQIQDMRRLNEERRAQMGTKG